MNSGETREDRKEQRANQTTKEKKRKSREEEEEEEEEGEGEGEGEEVQVRRKNIPVHADGVVLSVALLWSSSGPPPPPVLLHRRRRRNCITVGEDGQYWSPPARNR